MLPSIKKNTSIMLIISFVLSLFIFPPTNAYAAEPVTGVKEMYSVAGGNFLLHNDGTITAWGDNHRYRMATTDSSPYLGEDIPYPQKIDAISNVRELAVGSEHTMALKNDGTLWGWGSNRWKLLNNNGPESQETPVEIPETYGQLTAPFLSIDAGSLHNVVLTNNGNSLARGGGPDTPGGLLLAHNWQANHQVKKITSGESFTLVWVYEENNDYAHIPEIDMSDDYDLVYAFGRNGHGVFGNGTTAQTPSGVTQTQRYNTFYDGGIRDIDAGSYHVLMVRTDGTVQSWGNNRYGQLGLGNASSSPKTTPQDVFGLSNITKVSAGEDHSLALRSDGTVWAWGYNHDGQLGDGVSDHGTPIADGDYFNIDYSWDPVQVSNLTGVVDIEAGRECSLARKNDGTIWYWGKCGALSSSTPAQLFYGAPLEAPSYIDHNADSVSISLTWTPVDNATSYNVYVDTEKHNDSDIVATEYTIDNLEPDTEYEIQIQSKSDDIESSLSNPIVVRTQDIIPITPPNNVNIEIGELSITITWDAVDNATGYNIYQSTNGSEYVLLDDSPLPPNPTSYTVTGLDPNSDYSFQVSAIVNGTEGDRSEETEYVSPNPSEDPDSSDNEGHNAKCDGGICNIMPGMNKLGKSQFVIANKSDSVELKNLTPQNYNNITSVWN